MRIARPGKPLGLRAQLVAAFLGIAVLTALLAAVLTSWGLHRSVDRYLEERSVQTSQDAATLAAAAYEEGGGWTPGALGRFRGRLVLSEHDYRLVAGGVTLIDTTADGVAGEVEHLGTERVLGPDGEPVARLEILTPAGGALGHADGSLVRSLDRAHIAAAVIAGLTAVVLGLIMARRLSRPLVRLAATAVNMAAGSESSVPERCGPAEVQRLADALDRLARDLDRQTRSRRQLADDLSHELRTPLMLVQGRVEAMQDGIASVDGESLEDVHSEIVRMGRLVGQIEHLASETAESPPLRTSPARLDLLVGDVERTLRPALEERGMRLETETTEVTADLDQDATIQILMNLLVNVQIHGPHGGEVRVSVMHRDGRAVVRVADSGRIPPSERVRVFDRFHRAAGARTAPGLGVGLTIARDLAERQGGRLDLREDVSATVFELSFPLPPAAREPRFSVSRRHA